MSGEEWFSTDLAKGLSRIYNNSSVQTFVDAEEYFADLRKEVEATGKGGLICWIGFEAHGDTPMPQTAVVKEVKDFPERPAQKDTDKTWFDLLKAASDERGVAIRALLNLHPKPDMNPAAPKKYKAANLDLVEKLNGLQNCLAINDFRYLWMNGTHHQKLVLVYNAAGLSAYVGTCDVEYSRIVNRWCEVHCKIKGDVAAELYEVFHKRWSEHAAVFQRVGSMNSYLKSVNDLKFSAPTSGNFLMQVSTTYGNPQRSNPFSRLLGRGVPRQQFVHYPHRIEYTTESFGIGMLLSPSSVFKFGNDFFIEKDPAAPPLINEALQQAPTYAFAPTGHTGIYQAIAKAIETTKEFIYLEDQYLVEDMKMGANASMLDLLVKKVGEPTFKKLIVFCTRIDDINDEFQGTGWAHRGNFIRSLVSAGNDKVVVCQYKSRGSLGSTFGEPHQGAFYIHSKTWIFDDLFLITGSANCNRRGYSHDSELDVGVYDQNKQFVKDLRIRIWKSRLNTQGIKQAPLKDADLADFLSAARYWETPDKYGLTITNNREGSLEPRKYPDLDLASYRARVTGAPGFGPQFASWVDSLKMSGMWDFIVDPDGS